MRSGWLIAASPEQHEQMRLVANLIKGILEQSTSTTLDVFGIYRRSTYA
jgi:hypothetical protein